MPPLSGKRILIVEDEMLIAAMLEDMLAELGATVIASAATIAEGMRLARIVDADAAVLDINVRNERIDPVAEILRGRNVPMVFATGYGAGAVATARGAPIIDKPYTKVRLENALMQSLQAR